jgi:hypothetical protein
VKGHALTLNLIGGYLRDASGGDIRRRDLITLGEADDEKGGHAFDVMAAYVSWFESDGERGQRALAMLRLMGLFDRPADAGCLEALWRAPPIDGLTEPLVALTEPQRNIALTRLADAKLVTVNREGGALVSLDAHPLLREYFARHLCATRAEAWTVAHRRLFEYGRRREELQDAEAAWERLYGAAVPGGAARAPEPSSALHKAVIASASEAIQGIVGLRRLAPGSPRRCAPRDDGRTIFVIKNIS